MVLKIALADLTLFPIQPAKGANCSLTTFFMNYTPYFNEREKKIVVILCNFRQEVGKWVRGSRSNDSYSKLFCNYLNPVLSIATAPEGIVQFVDKNNKGMST